MGAWGMDPLSSDDFGDALLEVHRKLDKPLDQALDAARKRAGSDPYEQWAWVGLVIWSYHAGFAVHEFVKEADDLVLALQRNDTFMDSWVRSRGGKATPNRKGFEKVIKHVSKSLSEMRNSSESPGLVAALQEEYGEATKNPSIEDDLGINPSSQRMSRDDLELFGAVDGYVVGSSQITYEPVEVHAGSDAYIYSGRDDDWHRVSVIKRTCPGYWAFSGDIYSGRDDDWHRVSVIKRTSPGYWAFSGDVPGGRTEAHESKFMARVTRKLKTNPHDWPRSEIQSLLFSVDHFTAHQARAWAEQHGFRYGKVDTTDHYHRLRQFDPSGAPCRTMELPDTHPVVKAVVCRASK